MAELLTMPQQGPAADVKPASLWSECRKCGHQWPLFAYPKRLVEAIAIYERAKCPQCGEPKPRDAPQKDGQLLERSS